jgi:hypothetical protein
MGVQGYYGERKTRTVQPDGAIRLKRVTVHLRAPECVPSALLEALPVDAGGCAKGCPACKIMCEDQLEEKLTGRHPRAASEPDGGSTTLAYAV